MQSKLLLGTALLVASLALAGCSTQIETQQTEPFRIQLEGEPRTVTVDEADDDAEEVVVETCDNVAEDAVDTCDVEQVEVQVKVKAVEGPCTILVTIKDDATGQVLEQRTVTVGGTPTGTGTGTGSMTATGTGTTTGTNSTTATMTGTQTGTTGTGTGDSSGVTIQNIMVNVKGKENIVVLTQAQQGSAQVDISAIRASGNAEVGTGTTTGTGTMTSTGTGTTTDTGTTSATTTTTSTGTTTTSPP